MGKAIWHFRKKKIKMKGKLKNKRISCIIQPTLHLQPTLYLQNKETIWKNRKFLLMIQAEIRCQVLSSNSVKKAKEESRMNQKAGNQMFYSSVNPMRTSMTASQIGQELKEFMLPKTILRVLEEEEPNMAKIISHLEREKRKIDVDIDQTVSQILSRINDTKRKLHKVLDDYLEMFRKNYETLKTKCKEFKEKALFAKPSNDRNYLCSLKKITYFGKMSNSVEPVKKLKEEGSKLQATIESLEKEVARKELTLLAEELNKQSLHVPLYNHSETSQLLLTELRQQLVKGVDEALDNFNHLIFVAEYPDFSTFTSSPEYTSVVAVDKSTAIGEFKDLRVFSAQVCSKIETNLTAKISCSALLSLNNIVIGCEDGSLNVWNLEKETYLDKLVLRNPIRFISGFRGYDFDYEPKSNAIANIVLSQMENERKDYIACVLGDELEILKFDGKELLPMKIHLLQNSFSINGVLSLFDGISLGTVNNEGELRIYNMVNGKAFFSQKISQFSLNAIAISKDYKTLALGGTERLIFILNITHSYSITAQKQIVDSISLIKTIQMPSAISVLNFGTLERNLIFVGGTDYKIRICNFTNGSIEKEIVGHKSPVTSIKVFENPFDYSRKKNFILLSASSDDPHLKVSTPYSALNNALCAEYSFNTFSKSSLEMGLMKGEDSEIYIITSDIENEKTVLYKMRLS